MNHFGDLGRLFFAKEVVFFNKAAAGWLCMHNEQKNNYEKPKSILSLYIAVDVVHLYRLRCGIGYF